MFSNKNHSNSFLKLIKVISFFSLISLTIASCTEIVNMLYKEELYFCFSILFSSITMLLIDLLLITLFIFPTKLEILGFIFLLISSMVNMNLPYNYFGLFIYAIGITIFAYLGYFNNKKIIKICLFSLLYFVFLIFQLWVLDQINHNSFFYIVVQLVCFFFIVFILNYLINDFILEESKILNIGKYKNLSQRDAEWLQLILDNEKYERLAIDYKMSLGAVKNRLHIIFNTIHVKDRADFLNKYSNYKIEYHSFSSKTKNKT